VIFQAASDLLAGNLQGGRESDLVEDFTDNADAKTLVEQPSIARQDTKVGIL